MGLLGFAWVCLGVCYRYRIMAVDIKRRNGMGMVWCHGGRKSGFMILKIRYPCDKIINGFVLS